MMCAFVNTKGGRYWRCCKPAFDGHEIHETAGGSTWEGAEHDVVPEHEAAYMTRVRTARGIARKIEQVRDILRDLEVALAAMGDPPWG